MPQLFDGLRRSRLDGMNPPPIKARKQGFELGVGQRNQSIFDTWPSERVLFKPFVGQHDTGAIPVDQLQPIRLAEPEHEDCSGERLCSAPHNRCYVSGEIMWRIRPWAGRGPSNLEFSAT